MGGFAKINKKYTISLCEIKGKMYKLLIKVKKLIK
jgi:hypothetical protein